jgi:CHASE3 domain sensor protein
MVVAEVLTGIALVKQATDFIKSNINAAKDIGQIADKIDDLFRGEHEAQKARNKKAGIDTFSVNSVAQEVIDAKLAAEKLREVAVLIDMRFGPGTWAGIVNERAKRIQEAKEAERKRKIEQARKEHEFWEAAKATAIAVVAIGAMALCFVVVLTSSI